MPRVAIIGCGIVGVTTAFYLKKAGMDVDVFDAGYAQGTSAAVGIICPWVSQRRNKNWYALARDGAAFYKQLIRDLPQQTFYTQNGTLITHPTRLDALYKIAMSRLMDAPDMDEVVYLEAKDLQAYVPQDFVASAAILIKGGAQVDGQKYIQTLLDAADLQVIHQTVQLKDKTINGVCYDAIVVASGPWINEVVTENYNVSYQKGQLVEIAQFVKPQHHLPVFMPKGELDLLYQTNGTLVIGASHENDTVDTQRDQAIEAKLIEDAKLWIPRIGQTDITGYRIGLRANTPNNEPFYGLSGIEGVYVASGLGSSGLTTGPLIGYRLAQHILGESVDFSRFDPQMYRI